MQKMKVSVCTLFEKNYHYGVGVLVNSLYRKGFRGICWVGYRGDIPDWAQPCLDKGKYLEFQAADSCCIRFVELKTKYHLANYKPSFMLDIFEVLSPETEALFYFDPDIVNKSEWDFYERWVSCGIAICEDQYPNLSSNHPKRVAWKKFAEQRGFVCEKSLDSFYNSGCIGVKADHKSILLTWKKLLDECISAGHVDMNSLRAKHSYPYLYDDQCVLSAALMFTKYPLSVIGPEGMDFGQVGGLMAHAVGPIAKPWQRQFILEALKGIPPRSADKVYWQETQSPVAIYDDKTAHRKKFQVRLSSLISYFIKRSQL